MTTKFTDLTEIAAVDVDDDDVLALSDISASASRKVTVASLRTAVATELSQVQVEDDTSTVFGSVSGERLGQSVAANLNAAGAAPLYACRAWVNFNGTGTVAIRASGNVSSITDNGAGRYTVNFSTSMPDVNYAAVVSVGGSTQTPSAGGAQIGWGAIYAVGSIGLGVSDNNTDSNEDSVNINVAIFR